MKKLVTLAALNISVSGLNIGEYLIKSEKQKNTRNAFTVDEEETKKSYQKTTIFDRLEQSRRDRF